MGQRAPSDTLDLGFLFGGTGFIPFKEYTSRARVFLMGTAGVSGVCAKDVASTGNPHDRPRCKKLTIVSGVDRGLY